MTAATDVLEDVCPLWCADRGRTDHMWVEGVLCHTSEVQHVSPSLYGPGQSADDEDPPDVLLYLSGAEDCQVNIELDVRNNGKARLTPGQAAHLANALTTLLAQVAAEA